MEVEWSCNVVEEALGSTEGDERSEVAEAAWKVGDNGDSWMKRLLPGRWKPRLRKGQTAAAGNQ